MHGAPHGRKEDFYAGYDGDTKEIEFEVDSPMEKDEGSTAERICPDDCLHECPVFGQEVLSQPQPCADPRQVHEAYRHLLPRPSSCHSKSFLQGALRLALRRLLAMSSETLNCLNLMVCQQPSSDGWHQ